MHCFASENQTYTETWLFGVVLKVFKRPRKPTAENLQVKTRVENVRFLSWRIVFVGKYGIHSTNEKAFKRNLTLRASFRFPAIRFDAPTLLSFSGFTHAHAKCPPVTRRNCHPCGFHLVETSKKRTGTAKKLSLSFPAPLPPLLSLSLCTENLERAITLENNWLYLVVCRCFHRSWGYFGFELKMLGSFEIRDCFFLLFLGRFDIVSLSINCSTSQVMVLTI